MTRKEIPPLYGYGLSEFAARPGERVFVCPGDETAEVDALRERGFLAVCPPGIKLLPEHCAALRGRPVTMVYCDRPGWKALAEDMARRAHGHAARISVLGDIPGMKPGTTVAEWLADGGTPARLVEWAERVEASTEPDAFARPMMPEEAEPLPEPERFQPFPVEVFPDALRRFVSEGAKAMCCDETFLAMPLLAAMASAIGNARRIRLKQGWEEPCVLWTITVSNSGNLKSPTQDKALAFLRAAEFDAERRFQSDEEAYRNAKLRYDSEIQEWKAKGRKAGEEPPEEPAKPTCERYTCDDVTVETLAGLLKENPRGLLCAKDELSEWFGSFDAYTNARGKDEAKWLSMHRSGIVKVDRGGSGERKTISVRHAAVCLTGNIQPEVLRRTLSKGHTDNGLAARMLYAIPPERERKWSLARIEEKTEAGVAAIFDALLALPLARDADGNPAPVDVPVSAEAEALFAEFFNSHNRERLALTGNLRAAWGKLEGAAARLALVIRLSRNAAGETVNPDEIDGESMRRGIVLAEWFKNEARRVYGRLEETPKEREQRELVEYVRSKGGRMTVRQLQRGPHRYRKSEEEARLALDGLVEAGLGGWHSEPSESRTKYVATFVLHPESEDDGDTTGGDGLESPDADEPSPSPVLTAGDCEAAEPAPKGNVEDGEREVIRL